MKKIVFLSVLFLGVLFCTPLSADTLVTYTHNYGNGTGQFDPGGNDPLSNGYVTVKDSSSSRFYDSFDFSGLTYGSIDHFALTLTFSGAGPRYGLFGVSRENWYVRPGGTESEKPQFRLVDSESPFTSNTFIVDSSLQSTLNDDFDDMVANGKFYFWFADEGYQGNDFKLYSATLDIQGTPAQNPEPNPVPEPGSIILLGTGLLGMAATKRRSKR